MAKKTDGFVGKLTDGELAKSILESANQIWLAGLGAFAKAQDEGMKAFDTFVKEGEHVQERARKVAGDRLTEVKDKATDTWDKLEDVFEGRVSRALRSLSVPHKRDVDALAKRVAELTEAVDEFAAKTVQKPAPKAKPAAAPAAAMPKAAAKAPPKAHAKVKPAAAHP